MRKRFEVLREDAKYSLDTSHTQYSEVFIDKLSITVNLNTKEKEDINTTFRTMVDGDDQPLHIYSSQSYKNNCSVELAHSNNSKDAATFFFSWDPNQLGYRYLRIDFNPNNYDLHTFIQILYEQYDIHLIEFMERGKVTRVDFALDIYNVPRNKLAILSNRIRTNRTYSGDKGLATEYIGSVESNRTIVLYDKKAEAFDKNKTPYVGNNEVSRLEIRLKQDGQLSLRELVADNLDIFNKTKLIFFKHDNTPYLTVGRLLVAHASSIGILAALKAVPDNEKKQARKILLKSKRYDLTFQSLFINNKLRNIAQCVTDLLDMELE